MSRFKITVTIVGITVWVLVWGLIGASTNEIQPQALDNQSDQNPPMVAVPE